MQASPLSPHQTTRSFSTLLLSLQPHQPQHLTKRETIYPLASSTESIRSESLLQIRPLRFNFCPTTCLAGRSRSLHRQRENSQGGNGVSQRLALTVRRRGLQTRKPGVNTRIMRRLPIGSDRSVACGSTPICGEWYKWGGLLPEFC